MSETLGGSISNGQALTLVIAVVSLFVYTGCADTTSPTGASPVVPGHASTSQGSGLSMATGLAETADEDFNCKNVGGAYVRFSDPGFIEGTKVGMWVKYEGMPEGRKKLRIWWDYSGEPDSHRDIDISDVTEFEQVIEHQYMNLDEETKLCVRIELILFDNTGNCARNRWITIKPTSKAKGKAAPGPCGGAGSCTVFVTSTRHSGNLGGLAGGDAICQSLADAAGLPGTFKAWLSDSTGSPATRFTKATVPYVLTNGAQIATDWTDLTDGVNARHIDINETGGPRGWTSIWTGTRADGTPAPDSCNDWSSNTNAFKGSRGHNRGLGSWSYSGSTACGVETKPLYCFQQ